MSNQAQIKAIKESLELWDVDECVDYLLNQGIEQGSDGLQFYDTDVERLQQLIIITITDYDAFCEEFSIEWEVAEGSRRPVMNNSRTNNSNDYEEEDRGNN